MTATSKLCLKTHNKTGLKYLCITSRQDPSKYLGSGTNWLKHIKKHGRHDIKTKILYKDKMIDNDTSDKFKEVCRQISKKFNVVEDKRFANLIPEYGTLGAYGNIPPKFANKQELWDYKLSKEGMILSNEPAPIEEVENTSIDNLLDDLDRKKIIAKVFRETGLTHKQERIMRMRYGINMDNGHTAEEVGQQFSITRNRIFEIEGSLLRKLYHNLRKKFLQENNYKDTNFNIHQFIN